MKPLIWVILFLLAGAVAWVAFTERKFPRWVYALGLAIDILVIVILKACLL